MLADKHTDQPRRPRLHDHGPEGRQVPQRQGDGRQGRGVHAQPDAEPGLPVGGVQGAREGRSRPPTPRRSASRSTQPSGVFLANLANVICPVVIYPEGEVEKQGGAITKPVGTGPFEFVEWKKDAYLRVKKFKDYVADSRPTSGLAGKKVALVETVDFIPIPDSSVRAAAIEKGDVDIAIELNVEDVRAHEGQAGPGRRVQARHRVRRPPLRLQDAGRSATRSSARPSPTPSTRTSSRRPPPAARASRSRRGSRPACRSTGRCRTRTPTPSRTSRRPSSSCRRPATRARRSS